MRLPEDSADVVEDFVKWIYTGEVMEMKLETFVNDDKAKVAYKRVFALYGFAEKICAVASKKVLVDRLFGLFAEFNNRNELHNLPQNKAVHQVYSVTPTGSALRKLIVAADCHVMNLDWYVDEDGAQSTLDEGNEHAAGVLRAFAARLADRYGGDPFEGDNAEYFYDEDMKTLANQLAKEAESM